MVFVSALSHTAIVTRVRILILRINEQLLLLNFTIIILSQDTINTDFIYYRMAVCMMSLAIATSFPTSNLAAQIVSVLFVFLFNFFIPIGFLGANFLYCTEVAPLRLRVAMSSISTANHWLWYVIIRT